MSRIVRSTDIGKAIRSRQKGFLLNPFRFAAPGGGGFSGPDDVPGLIAWFDFSDTTKRAVTGSDFDSITCKKTGTVFTTGANKPVVNTAGGLMARDCANFTSGAARYFYNATGITLPLDAYIFMAMYWGTSTNQYQALGLMAGALPTNAVQGGTGWPFTTFLTGNGGTDPATLVSRWSGSAYVYSTSFAKGTKALAEAELNASRALTNHYKNGVVLSKALDTGTIEIANIPMTTIGSPDTLYTPNGAFGEICIYSAKPSTINIGNVRTYLQSRWGLP